jgi:hypothetical protein
MQRKDKSISTGKGETENRIPAPSPPSKKWEALVTSPWAHLCILIAASFVLYANSLSGGFIWDDRSLILQNPLVQTPSRAFEAFLWRMSIFGREFGYYRPLVILSFALDQTVWQGRAFGFHLTNLILHIAVVLSLYRILFHLWGWRLSFYSSGLFSVFACHTENVSFISGRMDILSTLFMLLGLLFYFRRTSQQVTPASLGLCSLLVLCAMLSKELAIIFPALFALCVIYLHPKRVWKGHFLRGALFIGGAFLVYGVIRIIGTGGVLKQNAVVLPVGVRILILPSVLLRYIQLLVFPFNLNAYQLTSPPVRVSSFDFIGPLALLTFLVIVFFYLARRSKPLAFGCFWFLAGLFPALIFLVILSGTTMADRFLYLPSAGFALLLASLPGVVKEWGGNFADWLSRGIWAILILIGLNNAIFTLLRNPVWGDEKRFFTRLVEQDPILAVAHHNLGYAYYREGDLRTAESEYRKALSLNPDYAESHATLGDVLVKTGRYREAIAEYEAYLRFNPDAPNREKAAERIQHLKLLVGAMGGDASVPKGP